MVWGMMDNYNFKKFYLEGEDVGWDEKLSAYLATLSEEERNEIHPHRPVIRMQTNAINKQSSGGGGILEPHEQIDRYKLTVRPKEIGDLAQCEAGCRIASQALKDLIEEFEPGIHQFWPIDIELPDGSLWPDPFYGFQIVTQREAFDPEQSDPDEFDASGLRFRAFPCASSMKTIAIRKDALNGAHIWVDPTLLTPDFFFSDAIKTEIKARKLVLPRFYKLKDV